MKTCLVGCGGIAAVHGSVLTSGIDTEFVAAADIKPEKAHRYAGTADIPGRPLAELPSWAYPSTDPSHHRDECRP